MKSGYGLDLDSELKQLRAARALAKRRRVTIAATFLGAHAVPTEAVSSDAYIDLVCTTMIPAVAREGLAEAVDAFCERIGFSPEQTARVFEVASAHGLRVKLHADQLSNTHVYAACSPLDSARFRPITSSIRTKRAWSQWRPPGSSLRTAPRPCTFSARPGGQPIEILRPTSRPDCLRDRCNPGTSPLTSLLLTMNMGATLFGLTIEECLAGVTRGAACGARAAVRYPARSRPASFATWQSGTSIARPTSPCAWDITPAACPRLERTMTAVLLRPGLVALADWLAIYRGSRLKLDPSCRAAIKGGADAVERIVERGEPVYGINTGFGKLASVRIATSDLAALQPFLHAVARPRA